MERIPVDEQEQWLGDIDQPLDGSKVVTEAMLEQEASGFEALMKATGSST